ncbi:hypothetical protein EVAR_67800_1 [Eumeta japonica]|uniref:Uncharacterized protein n=1 Tax=Eumeta variegata TaxID=151549 RepID=A0A4C2A334_EUMVA|nr:hypothetical protein EVAR_67800_1 [Eumeta japonica]
MQRTKLYRCEITQSNIALTPIHRAAGVNTRRATTGLQTDDEPPSSPPQHPYAANNNDLPTVMRYNYGVPSSSSRLFPDILRDQKRAWRITDAPFP